MEHARIMFDTKGSMQDPFGPSSALKTNPVEQFPQDYFFVLRVVQLLRGAHTRPLPVHAYYARSLLRLRRRFSSVAPAAVMCSGLLPGTMR